jgi:hypothetical protein
MPDSRAQGCFPKFADDGAQSGEGDLNEYNEYQEIINTGINDRIVLKYIRHGGR